MEMPKHFLPTSPLWEAQCYHYFAESVHITVVC